MSLASHLCKQKDDVDLQRICLEQADTSAIWRVLQQRFYYAPLLCHIFLPHIIFNPLLFERAHIAYIILKNFKPCVECKLLTHHHQFLSRCY